VERARIATVGRKIRIKAKRKEKAKARGIIQTHKGKS
jgi:hypothetical protein